VKRRVGQVTGLPFAFQLDVAWPDIMVGADFGRAGLLAGTFKREGGESILCAIDLLIPAAQH
jgi:hypothetical protein